MFGFFCFKLFLVTGSILRQAQNYQAEVILSLSKDLIIDRNSEFI